MRRGGHSSGQPDALTQPDESVEFERPQRNPRVYGHATDNIGSHKLGNDFKREADHQTKPCGVVCSIPSAPICNSAQRTLAGRDATAKALKRLVGDEGIEPPTSSV